MENLIERLKEAVRFAESEGYDMDNTSWGMQEGCLISYDEAKEIIKLLENSSGWISVEEHLPTKKEIDENWKFLVANKKDNWVDAAYYEDGKWNNGECEVVPTHYQPLLKSPKNG